MLPISLSTIIRVSFFHSVSGELIEEEESYEAKIDAEETTDHLEHVKALEIEGSAQICPSYLDLCYDDVERCIQDSSD